MSSLLNLHINHGCNDPKFMEVSPKCIHPKLSNLINPLAATFTHPDTANWFAAVCVGFILRTDSKGVSSLVRALKLDHSRYKGVLNFFRSDAWAMDHLACTMARVTERYSSPLLVAGKRVLIGDGTFVSKQGIRMPGIGKIGKVTENSPEKIYINAHLFGTISMVCGEIGNHFSVPLDANIQQGLKEIADWAPNEAYRSMSHVEQMSHRSCLLSEALGGKTISVFDRYFFGQALLDIHADARGLNSDTHHLVVRLKHGIVAMKKFQWKIG